jgi:FAD synthetase
VIYVSQFVSKDAGIRSLVARFFNSPATFEKEIAELGNTGLIEIRAEKPTLTRKGRQLITVVMTGGSFDIIHPGHVDTLDQAKSLGDVLVVSVARDSTFERNKKRKPEHSEALRRKLVSSLRAVDLAVLGSETDILETVEILKPDVIALGYDQFHDEEKLTQEMEKRGLDVKVVRLKSTNPEIKTTSILNRGKLDTF